MVVDFEQVLTLTLRNGEEVFMRRMRRTDANLIYDFFLNLSPQSRQLFHPHPFDYFTAETIAAEADSPHSFRLVALSKDGLMVGYAYWRQNSRHRNLPIVSIAVADSYQNQGLGRQLMNFLIEAAKEKGKKGLELTVFKNNERAIHLYSSLGFRIVGETDDYQQHVMRLEFEPVEESAPPPKWLFPWWRRRL